MPKRGFTLIEVLVVITVLALAAAIVVPSLPSMLKSQRKRDFFAGLERMTFEAVNIAKTSGQPVRLIASENGSFQLQQDNAEAEPQSLRTVSAVEGISATAFNSGSGSLDANSWEVTFYRDGTSSGGNVRFEEGSAVWTFRVDKKDGRGEVISGDAEEEPEERWEAGDRIQR
ncbi:MAG: hypothetical protein HONBIEJF_01255 [Fimbriimonadaceae bacterium]|nr:hypothetical protein [Fimbriimonadaceae bacterium]